MTGKKSSKTTNSNSPATASGAANSCDGAYGLSGRLREIDDGDLLSSAAVNCLDEAATLDGAFVVPTANSTFERKKIMRKNSKIHTRCKF